MYEVQQSLFQEEVDELVWGACQVKFRLLPPYPDSRGRVDLTYPRSLKKTLPTQRGSWIKDPFSHQSMSRCRVIGKGQKFRRIPLETKPLIAIKDYLKVSGNGIGPDHPLFNTLGKHGPYEEKGLTPKAVDCFVKSLAKKALIRKKIHPHVMWHTFATPLLDKGNDLKTVQALMGHSHFRTTEAYHHSTDDRKVEAIRSLQFGV